MISTDALMIIARGKTSNRFFGYNTVDAHENIIWTFQEKEWINKENAKHWFKKVYLTLWTRKAPTSFVR